MDLKNLNFAYCNQKTQAEKFLTKQKGFMETK